MNIYRSARRFIFARLWRGVDAAALHLHIHETRYRRFFYAFSFLGALRVMTTIAKKRNFGLRRRYFIPLYSRRRHGRRL